MNVIKQTLVGIVVLMAATVDAEDLKLHSFKKTQLSDEFYSEGATYGDINRDGVMDLVSGPYWYAGPTFAERHEYYEPKVYDTKEFSDNFFAFIHDVNEDGWNDIVIVGFPGKEAWWFANPQGKAGNWARHLILKSVDGESPMFADLTGDGNPDLVCLNKGRLGFAELPKDPTQRWEFHPVSEDRGYRRFTHGMGLGDLNKDGRADVMQKEGWWEQPAKIVKGELWKFHPVKFAEKGGAQMYAFDIDGDGDNDVVSSIDAHGNGLSWFENAGSKDGEIEFKEHTIVGARPEDNEYGVHFHRMHAIALSDVDRDGLPDVVTGRRGNPEGPSALYWFQTKRDGAQVHFVPHRIDMNSGVGTQVVVGDFTGDKWDDIVVGNKKGTFVFTHVVKDVDRATWEAAQPKLAKERPAK